jgi:hypothetical protein
MRQVKGAAMDGFLIGGFGFVNGARGVPMCGVPSFSHIRIRRRAPKLRGKHVFRVRACGQKNILKKDLVKWKKGSYICTRFGQENLSLSVSKIVEGA